MLTVKIRLLNIFHSCVKFAIFSLLKLWSTKEKTEFSTLMKDIPTPFIITVILCTFTNYLLKTAKILGLSIIAIIIIVSPSLLKGYSACKFVFSLKVNIYLQNMRIEHTFTRFDFILISLLFLCEACLHAWPASLIMHVPISELHALWY